MNIKPLALAAALALAALSTVASADTLHGTDHRGGHIARRVIGHGAVHRTVHHPAHRTVHGTAHRAGHRTRHGAVVRTFTTHRGHRYSSPIRPVHVHRHDHCRYLDGHHVVRRRRVVLPGHHVERVVAARYEFRWSRHGQIFVRVLVQPEHIVREWIPERVEFRNKRVWVPGRWVCS